MVLGGSCARSVEGYGSQIADLQRCELFLATLQHYRAEGHYLLHAFVVMPDHIHLLLTPTETLERTMSLIKGGFSHRLASKLPVWQRSYTDHRIRDRQDFLTHRSYIYQNPVRAKLCGRAEEYPHSSAREESARPATATSLPDSTFPGQD